MLKHEPRPNSGTLEHVVFVIHSSRTVGVERSTVALVRAARAQQARVTVILPKPGPILGLLQGIDGVEIRYLRAQWWMGFEHHGWRGAVKLVQTFIQSFRWWPVIARLRPTTVYVMSTVIPAPMLATRLARVPLVVFLSESIRTNPGYRSVLPKSLIIKCVRSWASVTVARSNFAAEQYGGASLIEASDIGDPHDDSADRPDRSGHLRKLVMLGTLSTEKGQLDAVHAIGLARDEGVALTFDLYGDADPGELSELNALIESQGLAGLVRHRGVTTTPLAILRSADLSLVCSRNEAYGRVTVESLSVGTPVLGYRAGGTAEILAEGGGLAVDPSIAALADALMSLSADSSLFQRLVRDAGERQRSKRGFGDADATIRHVRDAIAHMRAPAMAGDDQASG
jgi:glycosyltransferase involved in cell wall biosynthesis